MVKRISRSGYGTYREDKKLYHMVHGSEVYEYVPYKKWESEVVANPNGLTATKAKQQKDVDLDKIEVPVIGINHDHRVKRRDTLPITPTKTIKERISSVTVKPNITVETGKRWGWRTAEEGRGVKQHKIPMLENKEEDKSK